MRLGSSLRAAVLSIAVPVFTSSIAAESTPPSTPPIAVADRTLQPRPIPPFDGVWELNIEASVNPNGLPPPVRDPWPKYQSDECYSCLNSLGRARARVRDEATVARRSQAAP